MHTTECGHAPECSSLLDCHAVTTRERDAATARVRGLEAQVRTDHYRVSLNDGDRGPHVCWPCFELVDEGQEPTAASLWPCKALTTLALAPATGEENG